MLPFLCLAASPAPQINESDAWAFPTPDDPFTSDALNLRSLLNEKVAGQHGFVRLSKDRMSFVRGDGEPLRFWAVVSDGQDLKPDEMERHAAWLAKRGVNMVRVHANLSVNEDGAKVTDVNHETLDRIHRWVAICKKHGIYLTISPYWAHAKAPASWGIAGYAGEQPWGVLFFNPTMQEGYRAWVRALYTTPNPYANGVPLKDEPAVAIAQVKNEDSLLFWTFNAIKPEQKRVLGTQFAQWAIARHGSLDGVRKAWDNAAAEGDDFDAGVLGLRNLYEFTARAPRAKGGVAQRLADQMEFLTETQRGFYAAMERYFKTELGIKSLTNAMNWRSADQVTMDDAERYSYSAMDVSAVNYYTGGAHVGENNGYRIDPGHKFTSGSVLRGTTALPGSLKQTAGHPMMITETAWVHPALYQSEGPFLMTAYTAMNGVDVTFWFAHGSTPEWKSEPRWTFWKVGEHNPLQKWYGNYPMQAGQFPALALAFRRGYIKESSQPAVYEERSLEDMWNVRIPIISESGRFDPNRDTGSFAPESPVRQEVDRSAFYVGPVIAKYGGNAKNSRVADLSRFINKETGDVQSMTGELTINVKRGFAKIDAAKVQGVCGFLREAGGTFELGATRWQSTNDYAALVAVSLDGVELGKSRRILVQAGTLSRPKGFTTVPADVSDEGKTERGDEIVSTGEPPYLVVNTHATLIVANPHLKKATVLDSNLYPRGEVPVRRDGNRATVELPQDALYVVLE